MEIPDEVRGELVIRARQDRVWRALTEAEQLTRWFPDKAAEVDPRPEFTLEAIEGGTRLLVVESGFSRVREDTRGSACKDNDDGWTHELGELKTYLEAA